MSKMMSGFRDNHIPFWRMPLAYLRIRVFLFTEVGIDCHGGVYVRVAEEFLRGMHINVRLKQDGGVAVP